MRISRNGRALMLLMLVLLVSACASGTTDSTDAAVEAETTAIDTTAAPETTEDETDNGSVSALSDMPRECLDACDTFLLEIEPAVSDFDFQNATQADFEELSVELETISEPMDEATANCPELNMETDDSINAMIDYANNVAPGTVPYFEFIASFMQNVNAGSGDCDVDMAAFMDYVDAGKPMRELTLSEVTAVNGLMQSIALNCPAEEASNLYLDPDVAAFLGG
ncbi:hypothetical protein BH18ACT5_BH18ACT5_15750 [soil metagenome]